MNEQNLSQLPMQTYEEIPQPKHNAGRIIALVKESGRITGYKLDDGRVLSKSEGVKAAREGSIWGVGVARRGDTEYLKALPDGAEDNNLGNLPAVKG